MSYLLQNRAPVTEYKFLKYWQNKQICRPTVATGHYWMKKPFGAVTSFFGAVAFLCWTVRPIIVSSGRYKPWMKRGSLCQQTMDLQKQEAKLRFLPFIEKIHPALPKKNNKGWLYKLRIAYFFSSYNLFL